MKYKCIVFDHDDTVVDSTRNVHYPSFCAFMKDYRPDIHYTLEEYVNYNFEPGVVPFFKDICGLNDEELLKEQTFWHSYASNHVSRAFTGLKEIMDKHKENGGIIAVVSHSYRENILRDYEYNHLPTPDIVFGWEQPKEERKPSPIPIEKIMREYGLEKKDILVLDDLKPGLVMARNAGVDFAASGWCFDIEKNASYMKENADYFCSTVEEFKRIVE